MSTINITLPAAATGTEYQEAVTLTGQRPFKILASSLPAGMQASVIGDQLIFSGTPTGTGTSFEIVVDVASGCSTCPSDQIIAELPFSTTVDACPCTEVAFKLPLPVLPDATVGKPYYAEIELTGTGPFELCGGSVPYCLKAEIIGSRIVITGSVKQKVDGARVLLAVKNNCSCGCVDISLPITILAAPCSYTWSMSPISVQAGGVITTTVQLPPGCPASATLALDVFDVNSATPTVPIATVNVPNGVSTYTTQASDTGQHLVFKPAALQSPCLEGCTPRVAQTERKVTPSTTCSYGWSMVPSNPAVGQTVTTTVTLPPGCPPSATLMLNVYDLNSATPTIPVSTIPVPAGVSTYVIQPSDVGQNLEFRLAASQNACLTGALPCNSVTTRTVIGGAPTCVINWDIYPATVTVGQTTQLRVLSGPPNCSLQFQAYQSDGVTPLPGALVTLLTNSSGVAATSPAACTGAGVAIWKPVIPQPNVCASGCTFSVPQRTSTCTAVASTCELILTGTCTAGVVTYQVQGAVVGHLYAIRARVGGIWTGWSDMFSPAASSTFTLTYSGNPSAIQVRDTNDPNLCASNELATCGGVTVTNYYCLSGTCAPASSAPAGASGPYTSMSACQSACGSSGGCVADVFPPDDFSPAPPPGSTINTTGVAGVPWNMSFVGGVGVTFSTVGLPAGMAGTQTGTVFDLDWPNPLVGIYTFTITGSKPGCTSTTYTVRLTITASGALCTSLSLVVAQGSSAYAPLAGSTFNAADQLLVTTVTGNVGGTYTLNGVGTVNGAPYAFVSPVQTIGPGGVNTFSAPVGQYADYDVTWTVTPAGASPVTLCASGTSKRIQGSTCLVAQLVQGASGYVLTVSAPGGAIAVPFTAKFGGPSFGGSALCVDNAFGVVNSALTTDSAGGGNQFTLNVTGLPSGYTAAIAVALNPGTSQLTHQMCGTTCFEVSIP